MRGENRDYIPQRQSNVADSECDLSEGCVYKAKATKRTPHYREVVDKKGDAMADFDRFLFGGDY
jgi:hypothetical protein